MVAIARRGAADSLAAGITTTADYSFSGASATACTELGLRAIVYLEVFGTDPGADRPRLRRACRLASPRASSCSSASRRTRPTPAPLDVYRWCLSLGIPVGTHLAESAAENEWLVSGTRPARRDRQFLVEPTGRRSVATLEEVLGPTNFSAPIASTSTMTRSQLLAARTFRSRTARAPMRCSAAASRRSPACAPPASGSGSAQTRPPRPRRSTSGRSCAPPCHEPRARAATRCARRDAALRLATLDAARAIGLDNEVGSLTPGKKADLTVLSVAGSPYDPVEDPVAAAVFGGSPTGILETIVDGITRYRQGETAWQEVRSTASAARQRMLP